MGLGRFVKHMLITGTYIIDMVKNMIDEGSVVDGIKRTHKESVTEDNLLTSFCGKEIQCR